jgi:hypothetical protein
MPDFELPNHIAAHYTGYTDHYTADYTAVEYLGVNWERMHWRQYCQYCFKEE